MSCVVAVGRFRHFTMASAPKRSACQSNAIPLVVAVESGSMLIQSPHQQTDILLIEGSWLLSLLFLAGDWIGGEGVGDCLIGGPYLTLGR